MKVIPHKSYIPSSDSDVKNHFDYKGYKMDNIPLCQEVANLISHKQFGNEELSTAIVDKNDIETFQPIIDLLNNCDMNSIAGNTPLEKAANLIDKLEQMKEKQEQQSKDAAEDKDNDEETEDEETEDENENSSEETSEETSSESEMEESILKDMLKALFDFIKEQMESDMKAFIKMLLDKTNEEKSETKEVFFDTPPQIGDNPLKYSLLTEEIKKKLNNLAILGISKKIAFNNHPQKQAVRNMRHISEVNRLKNVSDYANPLFYKRLVDNALTVKANTPPSVQQIVLMIDDSGSMTKEGKREYVLAILIDRFENALKTKKPLIICKFITNFYDLQEIRSVSQLEAYFQKIGFEGYTTDIADSLINLNEYLVSKKIEANICVINDGDDYISADVKLPFVTHSVMLGNHNQNLSTVVKNSGGEYMVIEIKEDLPF